MRLLAGGNLGTPWGTPNFTKFSAVDRRMNETYPQYPAGAPTNGFVRFSWPIVGKDKKVDPASRAAPEPPRDSAIPVLLGSRDLSISQLSCLNHGLQTWLITSSRDDDWKPSIQILPASRPRWPSW